MTEATNRDKAEDLLTVAELEALLLGRATVAGWPNVDVTLMASGAASYRRRNVIDENVYHHGGRSELVAWLAEEMSFREKLRGVGR